MQREQRSWPTSARQVGRHLAITCSMTASTVFLFSRRVSVLVCSFMRLKPSPPSSSASARHPHTRVSKDAWSGLRAMSVSGEFSTHLRACVAHRSLHRDCLLSWWSSTPPHARRHPMHAYFLGGRSLGTDATRWPSTPDGWDGGMEGWTPQRQSRSR